MNGECKPTAEKASGKGERKKGDTVPYIHSRRYSNALHLYARRCCGSADFGLMELLIKSLTETSIKTQLLVCHNARIDN